MIPKKINRAVCCMCGDTIDSLDISSSEMVDTGQICFVCSVLLELKPRDGSYYGDTIGNYEFFDLKRND